MRNFRIFKGETPVSPLMSRGAAVRRVNAIMAQVPVGEFATVRDRDGNVIATREGTGKVA